MTERQHSELRLRFLDPDDEDAFMAGDRLLGAEGFTFALGRDEGMSWADYLDRLEAHRLGRDLGEFYVPSTFLVAVVDDVIVGRVSIRHRLNEFLAHEGGHIGFGILPAYRRRGYASDILRQSLVLARDLGIDRVLVTCDDDNTGSATVIERAGGVLESTVDSSHGVPVRRYWIG